MIKKTMGMQSAKPRPRETTGQTSWSLQQKQQNCERRKRERKERKKRETGERTSLCMLEILH